MKGFELETIDIRDALFEQLYELGDKDKNVIFITDDLDAFVLRKFKKDFPKQFINIGVAEQNMIDLAAGLACGKKKVFLYGICSYVTTRCFEQIKFSICSMNLPVVIIGVGAGLSFSFDGPSHHGVIDIALMRTLPEITILNPIDALSARSAINYAYKKSAPCYIRLDKGVFPKIYENSIDVEKGFKIVNKLRDVNIISTGYMTPQVLTAIKETDLKVKVGVVDLFRLKPIKGEFISQVIKKSKKIITVEENTIIGGLGSIISEVIIDNNFNIKLKRLALPDHQIDIFGTREWLLSRNHLDLQSLVKNISQVVN